MPSKQLEHQKAVETEGDSRKHYALTRLTEKAYSPLVIRKITRWGFPLFAGIICDNNLDTLDQVIVSFVEANLGMWKSDSIQDKRDLAGGLAEAITKAFPNSEGVAITLVIDKMMVSSLWGDMMNHFQCKYEYYTLLNMSTNI